MKNSILNNNLITYVKIDKNHYTSFKCFRTAIAT